MLTCAITNTTYVTGVTVVLSLAAVTGIISLASIVNRFSNGTMRKVLIAVYKPVLKTTTFAYGVLLCAHSQFHTIHNDCVGAAAIQYTVGSVLVALAIPSSPDRVCEKLLVVSNGAVWARSLYVVSTIVTFDFAASVAAVAAETGDATPLCSVLATVLGVGTDAQVAAWLARFTCCVTVLGLDSSCNLGLLPLLKRGACDLGYVVDYVVDAAKSIFASTRVNTDAIHTFCQARLSGQL